MQHKGALHVAREMGQVMGKLSDVELKRMDLIHLAMTEKLAQGDREQRRRVRVAR